MDNICFEILEKVRDWGFEQIEEIDFGEAVFTAEVRSMCEMNFCGKYGKNWMCPPGVGEVEELRAGLEKYKRSIMFNTIYKLEDSFDIEGMNSAQVAHDKLNRRLKELIENDYNIEDVRILGAGSCEVCEKCAYLSDEVCRFPDKAYASVEACGMDVVKTSYKFGFKYINGENTVTYFGVVLF